MTTTDRKDFYKSRVLPKIHLVKGWARNGLTDKQIASNLNIAESTFYSFLRGHQDMKDLLRSAREDAEIIVENALFKRAIGYRYDEVTRELHKDKDEEFVLGITKKVRKEVQGDVGAQQYWLEHRAPKRWEKNVSPEINPFAVNSMINNLAQLLGNPVGARAVGSEIDDE